MKKSFLFTFIASILAVGTLVSCGPTVSSSESSSVPSASDTSESVPSESGLPEWVDYAHNGSVRLTLDYKGKDFYKDGIGQVTLKTPIDGDTAHFTPLVTTTSNFVIKSRFYGIDTPESTGQVQPYGRGASNYTKTILREASSKGTIVVSSPQDEYKAPNPDSTGTRYVSLIWVNTEKKDAPIEELYLLNLMIVQDGWSWVKSLSVYPRFEETFYLAEEQARNYELNLFSGKPDESIDNGDYKDVSLLDIKREVEKQIADPNHRNTFDGMKVRIMATVTGYANKILYLQNYYTKEQGARYEEGEYAGVNIFTGAAGLNRPQFTSEGAYLEVCGICSDSEIFGFQISGCNFPNYPFSDSDSKVLIKAEDNTDGPLALKTFSYTGSELSDMIESKDQKRTDAINGSVKITTDVIVVDAFKPEDSRDNSYTLTFKDVATGKRLKWKGYVSFNFKPDPTNKPNFWYTTAEEWEGKQFTISGVYSYRKTSTGNIMFQVNPRSSEDLVLHA